MDEIVEGILRVDSWPQVAVVIGVLLFLLGKQWLDGRKINRVTNTVDQVRQDTAQVAHEVQNNSGKSLKDVAERTEQNSTDIVQAVAHMSDTRDEHLSSAAEESVVLRKLAERYLDDK
jgi:ribosomal protein L12E/L44/L45/RPP1/RPP2